jgi:T5SS/PEP-CTERM-associated repeat protein/autotransporter-associated beta strand protein
MTRLILSAALLSFVFIPQLKSQAIVAVPFDQLEASQYNIGLNGVRWNQYSTLSNFSKLYTTGWLNGKYDTSKPWNYYGPGADGILKYASNNAPPSIYGVNGFDASANVQHLLDNHHRVSGLYLLTTIFTNGYSATVTVTNASGSVITTNIGVAPNYTFVNQTQNWTNMSPAEFWSNMLAGSGGTNIAPVSTNANGFWSTTNQPTYLWANNVGVPVNPNTAPPPMIPNLTDDTLRDVAAQVNYPRDYGFTNVGYQNRDDAMQFNIQGDNGNGKVLYYQEFWWADYLRPNVYLIPTGSNISTVGMDSNAPYQFTDYHQLIAFSADFLCHSTNAANLPGYYDPGLVTVDFPYFRPGSSVLIGTNGSLEVSGSMIVDNGATLSVKGALTVTNETFYVGKDTANNTMIISDGGVVTNNNAVIGSAASATNNSTLITGSGSTWFLYGDLIVGESGSANSMNISNGGQVTNGLSVYGSVIGYGAGSDGNSVLVSGTNANGVASTWTCVNDLTVGWSGSSNSLVINQGGGVTSYIGIIGDDTNARGNHVLVDGAGSYWSNSNVLLIGVSGSGNSLFITNGGQVMAVNSDIGVNAESTANMVIVSGVGSVWTNSGNLTIGHSGSGNSLVISNGGRVNSSVADIGFAATSTGNSVLVTGNGSTWSNSGNLTIGVAGSGTLTVANGGVLSASEIRIGQYGDLDFGRYQQSDSAGSVVGEIVFTANNEENFGINFNQTNTFNFSNNVSGPGWICALGTGTTVMSGSNSYSQYTIIDAGAIMTATTNALGIGYVYINGETNSAALLLSNNLTISSLSSSGGGTNNLVTLASGAGASTLTINGSDSTNYSGLIMGALSLVRTGTGTTFLSGSNGFSNGTTIQGGVIVAGSTNALGRGALSIGGSSSSATLMLATDLMVGNFTWRSNGVVALTAGSQILTVAAMTNAGAGGSFQFLNLILNNNTNTLINFASQSEFTTNSFSVSGISGYSFGVTSNSVTAFISTNANLVVSDSVTINDSLTVSSLTIDSTGILRGTGTLSLTGGNLTVNGTLAPGNSPGTFYVTGGNLVMGSTSVWDQQIYSTSVYDRVVVTGSAFLNGTMNITTFGSGGLQFGEKYKFLTASGGISGAFSSITAPNGFRGRLLLSGNNTEANIVFAPSSYTLLAQGKNQIQVATALDSFIPSTSGDRLVISTSLDSLGANQYNQAFNAIMPTMYQSLATIAFNQANALNMQLNQRLWGVRLAEGAGFSMSGMDNMPVLEGQGDGPDKGVLDSKKDILRPGLDNHWGMFVDANGIFAQANSANMLPGYNAQSGGINAGLTYKWNENFASGIYCGYQGTYSKMGANGSGLGTGSSLIDNAVRFGVFGTYGHSDGKGLYANALAGGAYHNYQATRVIQYTGVNRTASSTPGAGELDTMLATGYDIQKGKFTFGPTASLQYTYLGVNPVNETGAQSLNFNSGGWNSSSMLSSLGAHAAYTWQASKNVVVVPQISLNWQHEFLQNPYNITGNLGGTSPTFSNTSATGIRDYLYTGVGFTMEFNKKWNTSFFYNAAAGNSDLVSQNIFWSAGVKF